LGLANIYIYIFTIFIYLVKIYIYIYIHMYVCVLVFIDRYMNGGQNYFFIFMQQIGVVPYR